MSPTHQEIDEKVKEIMTSAFDCDIHEIRVSMPAFAEWNKKTHTERYRMGMGEPGKAHILVPTPAGRIKMVPDREIKPGDWAIWKGDSAYIGGAFGWMKMPKEKSDTYEYRVEYVPEFEAPEWNTEKHPVADFLEELKKL